MAVGNSVVSFVSPGIYSIEKDLSQVPAAAVRLGGAFIGLTLKGPAFRPTRVSNFKEFRTIFGGYANKYSYVPYTVDSYFNGGGLVATIVRVLGKGDPNNSYVVNYGRPFILAFPPSASIATALTGGPVSTFTAALSAVDAVAVLRSRISAGADIASNVSYTGTPQTFDLNIDGTLLKSLSLDRTQKNYIRNVLGSNKMLPGGGDSVTSVYVDTVLNYRVSNHTGSITAVAVGSLTAPSTAITTYANGYRYVTGGYSGAHSPSIISQPFYTATGDNVNATAKVYDLFTIYTLTDGEAANKVVKVYIQNIQTTSDNPTDPNIATKFTVVVRDFYDTDKQPVVLETFLCNLDPASDNYIASKIGDRYTIITIDSPGGIPSTKFVGDFPNRSNYIRVAVNEGQYPFTSRPAGFRGPAGIDLFTLTSVANNGTVQTVYENNYPQKTDFFDTNNVISNRVYPGFLFDTSSAIGYLDRLQSSFASLDGAIRSKGFLIKALTTESEFFTAGISSNNNTLSAEFTTIDITATGSNASTSGISTGTYQFGFPLFGGNDGLSPNVNPIEAINDGTLSAEMQSGLNCIANPDDIDVNLLVVPGVHCGANAYNGQFTNNAIATCEDRADLFYIMDCGLTVQGTTGALDSAIADVVTNIAGYDTNYAATYYPWVRIQDTDVNRLVWVPPSVLVAGVYAFTDSVAAPWFAPAGVNRGMLPVAIEARRRLNQPQRDTLQLGRINPIKTRVNIGIYIEGQKTLQARASALDRVNVRRLLIAVKKSIAALALQVQYENNTARTRQQLKSIIEPALQNILLRQGIVRFQVTIDDTNNTPDVIDRNTLQGSIIIEPAKSIEIIQLQYTIRRRGANFSEILQQSV